MRCHYAYERARGFDDAKACALNVRGIEIRATSDPQEIAIVGSNAKATAALRHDIQATLPTVRRVAAGN